MAKIVYNSQVLILLFRLCVLLSSDKDSENKTKLMAIAPRIDANIENGNKLLKESLLAIV